MAFMITEVDPNAKEENKGIVLEVMDPELMDETGGIIQGNVRISDPAGWKTDRRGNPCVCQRSDKRIRDFCGDDAGDSM